VKATLYAVRRDYGWEAGMSVAWEVDRRYWRHERVWLAPSLPLGIAAMACERLNERWTKGLQGFHQGALSEAARWAAAQAGEPEIVNLQDHREAVIRAAVENEAAADRNSEISGIQKHQAMQAAERLRGCNLLLPEAMAALDADEASLLPALQLAALLGEVRLASAVGPEHRREGYRRRRSANAAFIRCRRCGSGGAALRRTPCASCGRQRCAYCEVCLTMGRSRECGLLVIGAPALDRSASEISKGQQAGQPLLANAGLETPLVRVPARWGLSPAQQAAAETALAYLAKNRREAAMNKAAGKPQIRGLLRFLQFLPGASRTEDNVFLLWAVTGAGKTEMMFPMLDAVLTAGGKVAVATPRRDVVLELAPRLAAAFPHVRRVVLYGGSEDRFRPGELTLATTHQLIRFREAFDLVVIDEVDAFPYHNDPALHYVAAEARARSGMTLLLSATPPPAMQRGARRGRLPHARVAVRHHRRPLPVPERLAIPPLSRWAAASGPDSRQLPAKLREAIRISMERGAQLFVFVPYIRRVQPLVQLLRQHASPLGIAPSAIDGTSSQDPQRGEKVTEFRGLNIRLLVTTTILERGVTVPKSDVFILDADKPLFDAASLVQMAGRAGRSADDPAGRVILAAAAWTRSQRDACRQIREMNAYARRKGYLLECQAKGMAAP